MGFSGSVNGTTKTQVFWILVFANVNGPSVICQSQKSMPGGVEVVQGSSLSQEKNARLFQVQRICLINFHKLVSMTSLKSCKYVNDFPTVLPHLYQMKEKGRQNMGAKWSSVCNLH